ncbi:hypothetical protein, variant [Puccinia striiformis f. sp. tritici PST-78]|uniref:Uncharacterized protein n=1 Tax=Puccinia striiformis f. sp. tritici PST-78 TaxID=1165861 RepID=A0A0L0UKK9_9BASI|nr:hypothetical protein PSTG_19099 [Puccinia striiformis f. sp. tritici PST-78]KNE87516.1 hypothetical protein, variant [Puccinia striiformis f. sp. tritici PST-78]
MLSVRSVHERAFTLSNDTVVPANLFLYNDRGMLWNPAPDIYSSHSDAAGPAKIASQFKLFEIIHPRPGQSYLFRTFPQLHWSKLISL